LGTLHILSSYAYGYRGYYYGGYCCYYGYVPAYYYGPAFYGWADWVTMPVAASRPRTPVAAAITPDLLLRPK
jgi:hypothetical protein